MPPSKLKHPIAVVRKITGLGQKELAHLVNCSVAEVQAIELRKRNLSKKLADAIWLETGVSPEWLLSGNPKAPPFTLDGKPYGIEKWKARQRRRNRKIPPKPSYVRFVAGHFIANILSLLVESYRKGELIRCMYLMSEGWEQLDKKYGSNAPIDNTADSSVKKESEKRVPNFNSIIACFSEELLRVTPVIQKK
jgi:transcriptional regulator with XRE-family HTH domain